MPRIRDEDESIEVPLTPLIDVVFLLLIFFLVATTFARKEMDHALTLPRSDGGASSGQEPQDLVINIRSDGTLVVEGAILTPAELRLRIRSWKDENPGRRVSLRADGAVSYQAVSTVLGLCKAQGIEDVKLPVLEPQEGPGS